MYLLKTPGPPPHLNSDSDILLFLLSPTFQQEVIILYNILLCEIINMQCFLYESDFLICEAFLWFSLGFHSARIVTHINICVVVQFFLFKIFFIFLRIYLTSAKVLALMVCGAVLI